MESGYVPGVHTSFAVSVCRGGFLRVSFVFGSPWSGVLCGAFYIDLFGRRVVGPDLGEGEAFVLGGWTGEVVYVA